MVPFDAVLQQHLLLLFLLLLALLNACCPSALVVCATATSRFTRTLHKSGSPSGSSSSKSKSKQKKASKKKSRPVSVGHGVGSTASIIITIIIAVLVILTVAIWWWRHRRARKYIQETEKLAASYSIASRTDGKLPLRLFSYAELKQATNNFASEQVIGCGRFGNVYKGVIDNETHVAIKSVKTASGLKVQEQILTEVQALLKVNNHPHLVHLLGFCVRWKLLLLVYKQALNGNLSQQLMQHKDGSAVLDWKTCLQFVLQSAEALAHLHSAGLMCHGNINSENILLDKSTINAKVSDYGLSCFLRMDQHVYDKSDVYSFGVLLLEVILSSRALGAFERDQDYVNQLVVMVQTKQEEGELDDVIDSELVKGESAETMQSMRAVVDLALQCLKENEANRPGLEEIAERLRQTMSSM